MGHPGQTSGHGVLGACPRVCGRGTELNLPLPVQSPRQDEAVSGHRGHTGTLPAPPAGPGSGLALPLESSASCSPARWVQGGRLGTFSRTQTAKPAPGARGDHVRTSQAGCFLRPIVALEPGEGFGPTRMHFAAPESLLVLRTRNHSWSSVANPEPSGPCTGSLAPGRAAHRGVPGVKQRLRLRAPAGVWRPGQAWAQVDEGCPDQSPL